MSHVFRGMRVYIFFYILGYIQISQLVIVYFFKNFEKKISKLDT